MSKLSPHQCAVLTAFTGILIGRMDWFHKYAEQVMERPVYTHEFAEQAIWNQLKDLSLVDDLVASA